MKTSNKGLTLTLIFKAESANYGEGFGNTSSLKKMTRDNGQEYTYISRQALRYNIIEQLGWDNTEVVAQGNGTSAVVQFAPSATIDKYPEIDLFGYMKTEKKSEDKQGGAATRNAVVRLSNALALSNYQGDMDYLTNMGLSQRQGLSNAIAESEINNAYYTYTITIDLDQIGVDANDNINISQTEKATRVNQFLETIQYLYRDIRGRRENLAPLFIIGGIYERKNPFFEHRIKIENNNIKIDTIMDLLQDETIKNDTQVGLLKGMFHNDEEIIEKLNPSSIPEYFNKLKDKVVSYYEGN